MMKILLGLILCLTFQGIFLESSLASVDSNVREFLENRVNQWPEIYLPNFKFSDTSKDLIYPKWFEGSWLVTSRNITNDSEEPVIYKVNFFKNDSDLIVGDRAKNSESIGKAIFGDTLIKVVDDPKTINNQITYLKDDFYIDSRVTGRNQINDENIFFADELVIQTAHKPGASRINQVETISKFQKCFGDKFEESNLKNSNICGFQYVASYGSKVGDPSIHAIKTNKYKLTFEFIES
ncbi:putative POLO box duplicated region [Prochlorococcus marinus str. MIT 9107]|uniref:Putative POLO box duplicated region n=2 Tax=Prochlorococcaceae TaxID=2881426 RepID=A0A0A1ZPH7_PROMR|nr:putative POLO box duplicated region [Prochlorococcus marinus str. MIT 9107]KGF90058.1 putative POLO box duplicated region [Prochlorococcus marinus str. MIT 9116]KGF95494.1 putative POLO box duplicated region [Prochlorococcus marinus str. MIT 9123]